MITSVVMHMFNEELLVGAWMDHHVHMFDKGIIINHQSTDNSVEIVRSKLPKDWQLVDTSLKDFGAEANDQEVMRYESQLPGWKMALNTTEFLFQPNLKEYIAKMVEEHPTAIAIGSRAAVLIDKEDHLPFKKPLWKNRTWGFLDYEPDKPVCRRWRYIHKGEHGHYATGRHGTALPRVHDMDFIHLHFSSSPWPECLPRKLQIQTRIPESDKANRLGFSHITNEAELNQCRIEGLKYSSNLLDYPVFNQHYHQLLDEFETCHGKQQ